METAQSAWRAHGFFLAARAATRGKIKPMQMAPWIAVAAGLGLTAAGMGAARLRRPTPQQKERLRRQRLLQHGRLAAGEILEWFAAPPAPKLKTWRRRPAPVAPACTRLIYRYEVAGVCYESSQDEELADPAVAGLLPGSPIGIKFDPRNPGNAMLLVAPNITAPQVSAQAAGNSDGAGNFIKN